MYESPHRILNLLEYIVGYECGKRKIAVCREISKLHEEIIRGTVSDALDHFKATNPKGEFVVVLGASEDN